MMTPYRFEHRYRVQNHREPWLLDSILTGLIIGGTLAAVVYMRVC